MDELRKQQRKWTKHCKNIFHESDTCGKDRVPPPSRWRDICYSKLTWQDKEPKERKWWKPAGACRYMLFGFPIELHNKACACDVENHGNMDYDAHKEM